MNRGPRPARLLIISHQRPSLQLTWNPLPFLSLLHTENHRSASFLSLDVDPETRFWWIRNDKNHKNNIFFLLLLLLLFLLVLRKGKSWKHLR